MNNKKKDEINSGGTKTKKRAYKKPAIREKELRAYFMLCSTNSVQCVPCTQLKQTGKCF